MSKFEQMRKYDPKLLIGIVLIGILSLILLFSFLKAVVVVLFFIGANTVLRFYKRLIPGIPLEFEFILFGSLMCTMLYGISAGIAIAILGSLLADSANGTISAFTFIMTAGFTLFSMLGVFLSPENFTHVGFVMVLIFNCIIWSIFQFIFNYDIFRNTTESVSNTFLNYFLFFTVAPLVLSILA